MFFDTLSILLLLFLSGLSAGALSLVSESPEYGILPAASLYAGYYLYRCGRANRRRWKDFQSWAKSRRYQHHGGCGYRLVSHSLGAWSGAESPLETIEPGFLRMAPRREKEASERLLKVP